MSKNEGPWAEVVQYQRRQHEPEPVEPDRTTTEMAHVGIERLCASKRQKHRPEGQKSSPAVPREKAQGVERIQGDEDAGVLDHLDKTSDRKGCEPQRHDRDEIGSNARASPGL